MKIYQVDFEPMYPVPYGLIIAAENEIQAVSIAMKELNGLQFRSIGELDISKPGVLFFENGDY